MFGATAEPAVAEDVALRTDNPNRWRTSNAKAEADLEPREFEEGKSCWAHSRQDDTPFQVCLDEEPPRASLKIQALSMVLAEMAAAPHLLRNRVEVITTPRSGWAGGVIVNRRGEHAVAKFDVTHRLLMLKDPQVRHAEFVRITTSKQFRSERYLREQLLPVLQEMMDTGRMKPAFHDAARRLLDAKVS